MNNSDFIVYIYIGKEIYFKRYNEFFWKNKKNNDVQILALLNGIFIEFGFV